MTLRIGLLSAPDMMMLGQQVHAIHAAGLEISAVILDSKGPNSRDLAIHEERTAGRMPDMPLSGFPQLEGRIHTVSSHNAPETVNLVKALGLDLLVNAGTPRILDKDLLMAPTIATLNCHPGMLPEFRGCSCVEWAILFDRPVANTVHIMTKGIDEGPVLLQEMVIFSKRDTYVDVRVKVYAAAHGLMARALMQLAQGSLDRNGITQGEGRYFKPMSADDLEIVKKKLSDGAYAYQRDET